jgi:hypothetical protein
VRQTVTSVRLLSPDRRLYRIATEGPPGVLPRWLLLERGRVYVESDQSAADLLKNPDASRAGAPLFAVYPWSDFDYDGQPAPDNAALLVGQSPHRALAGENAACVPELWVQSARFFTESWICPGRGIVDQITGVDVCGYVERYKLTRFSSGSTPARTGDGP